VNALLLVALCALPFAASAQTSTATLSGTVVDANNAVVPGATITVTEPATGLQRTATTNDQGSFTIPLLKPSTYLLHVEHQGFLTAEVRDIVLNVNDVRALTIKMKVGDVKETVNVSAEAPLINESPAVGTVVDRQFVANMPLNGRTFQSLIFLTPGIVPTPANGNISGQFSVNGQRSTTNYFSVDGVSANIGISGASGGLFDTVGGAAQATTATGGYNNLISMDAIQEFRVQTSTFAPEFGRTPGGQFDFVTRSGTNQFHGTLFDYLRNDVFDANNWFANSNKQPKPPERQNDFGGTFSGPVFLPRFGEGGRRWLNGRNKTFFFFSYEGLRLRQPVTFFGGVPSLAQRQTASAFYKPLLNAFSLPNGAVQPDGSALLAVTFSNPSTVDATSFRIDHTLNSRMAIFGRYNYSPSVSGGRRSGLGLTPNNSEIIFVHTQTFTVGETQTFHNTDANEIRINYSRNRSGTSQTLDSFGGGVPVSLANFVSTPIPKFNSFGFTVLGAAVYSYAVANVADNLQRQLNLVDTVSLSRGRHQLKAGIDYRRLMPVFAPSTQLLNFTTQSTNLTTSTLSTLIAQARLGNELTINNLSLFVQDTWHVTPRLVATYGVRWELNPPPSFNDIQPVVVTGFSLSNPAAASIAPAGTPIYHTTYKNFAPRIGIAYRLRENPNSTTALRGGFGYFYDLGTTPVGFIMTGVPFASTRTLTNVALPPTAAQLAPPAINTVPPFSGTVSAFDPNLKLPYTMQWNFAVEQGIGSNQTVTASYVAAVGRRLLEGLSLPAPNSTFTGSMGFTGNLATSDYHSMQLQFQRRLSRGIQTLASYTWSHSIDDQSNDVFAATTATFSRSNSNFDIRHRAAAAITIDIPGPKENGIARAIFGGWGLDPIFNIQSAGPVDLIGRSSVNIDGRIQSTRPNVIPGIPLYLYGSQYPGGKIINNTPNQGGTGCKGPFCSAPAGQQGNLGRNLIRAFPVSQVDLSLRRRFKVTERFNFQLRCDVFNIFNHPNFANPQATLSSSLFGTTTSMYANGLGAGGGRGGLNPLYSIGGPRSMQFSLKLNF